MPSVEQHCSANCPLASIRAPQYFSTASQTKAERNTLPGAKAERVTRRHENSRHSHSLLKEAQLRAARQPRHHRVEAAAHRTPRGGGPVSLLGLVTRYEGTYGYTKQGGCCMNSLISLRLYLTAYVDKRGESARVCVCFVSEAFVEFDAHGATFQHDCLVQ